jgi:hypothetical protein
MKFNFTKSKIVFFYPAFLFQFSANSKFWKYYFNLLVKFIPINDFEGKNLDPIHKKVVILYSVLFLFQLYLFWSEFYIDFNLNIFLTLFLILGYYLVQMQIFYPFVYFLTNFIKNIFSFIQKLVNKV